MLDRPFHFITVLWGERFRNYFLDYLLPSMLAPGNLPALRTREVSKFLIATTRDDWEVMKGTAIFREMAKYVVPALVPINAAPDGRSGCQHMGIGHKAACEIAYRDKAYAAILAPDSLLSDGSIRQLALHAKAGKKLVLVPACLRIAEEPFLEELTAMEVVPKRRARDTGKPIVVTGAQLAAAATTSLHSVSQIHEWDSYFLAPGRGSPCVWWRVSGNDGLLIHCLSWAPLLIDYGAFEQHDTSCLEEWTIDGDYVFKNMGHPTEVHVVRDSDEIVYAGFTPAHEQGIDLFPFFHDAPRFQLEDCKVAALKENFNSSLFDPLKKSIFFDPVRWHAQPIDESKWKDVEMRARDILATNLSEAAQAA